MMEIICKCSVLGSQACRAWSRGSGLFGAGLGGPRMKGKASEDSHALDGWRMACSGVRCGDGMGW